MEKRCDICGNAGNLIGVKVKIDRVPTQVKMVCEKCRAKKKSRR